jgi:hypothetical protein
MCSFRYFSTVALVARSFAFSHTWVNKNFRTHAMCLGCFLLLSAGYFLVALQETQLSVGICLPMQAVFTGQHLFHTSAWCWRCTATCCRVLGSSVTCCYLWGLCNCHFKSILLPTHLPLLVWWLVLLTMLVPSLAHKPLRVGFFLFCFLFSSCSQPHPQHLHSLSAHWVLNNYLLSV